SPSPSRRGAAGTRPRRGELKPIAPLEQTAGASLGDQRPGESMKVASHRHKADDSLEEWLRLGSKNKLEALHQRVDGERLLDPVDRIFFQPALLFAFERLTT